MHALAIVIALFAATGAAQAAEINAFISTTIKAATDELLPPFERANDHTIRASYAPSGALIPRFNRGEPVDVFLTDSTPRRSERMLALKVAVPSEFSLRPINKSAIDKNSR
jgi:ABC-type molybdate transport system substrate-binding protein